MERLAELGKLVGDHPQILVLQPTPYCNLDCSYCYLTTRDNRARMSDATLDAIASELIAPCPAEARPTLVWHGGEPMTLPPSWYEAAFERLSAASGAPALRHAFQTNGIGINDAWIDLWRKWKVSIGVSLDGPASVHDARRRTRSGRGSHSLVMAGITQLRDAGLDFHVISVLTPAALAIPDEIYDFYKAHGIPRVAFNIEEDEGQPGGTSLEQAPDINSAYRQFLCRFMERMRGDPHPLICREIEGVRHMIQLPHGFRRDNSQVRPFKIVSVGVDGGLSTFSPELLGAPDAWLNNFVFGNVRDGGGIAAMKRHPAFIRTHEAITRGVRACAEQCAYFDVCGGGAPANKHFELGRLDGTETLYCQLTVQATVETVLQSLQTKAPPEERPAYAPSA